MTKKNALTVSGIILSFAIAIGGWLLTSHLIDVRSDKLLSLTLDVDTNVVTQTASGMASPARPQLTEDEIAGVLRNWNWRYASDVTEKPHEPTDEQLSMEQAVEAAKEWCVFIGGLDIFPGEALRFEKASAYLAQKLLPELSSLFLQPEYSYWSVSLTNESMNARMIINAVTGQVWETQINILRDDIIVSEEGISAALDAFTAALDINFEGNAEVVPVYIPNGIFQTLAPFADGTAYASVTAHGELLEGGRLRVDNLLMYLSAG
ncbi:MAG: hypothetical protein LBS19_16715 [Clostridiales bacterium]|jgi:hypothetical protein|nr:hypothetical protein [Clostridiales bacterium]